MLDVMFALLSMVSGPQSPDDVAVQIGEARVQRWKKQLEKNPEDSEAAYQVGRHLCLTLGDWANGLPLLAKGKDKDLKQMASYELGLEELPKEPKSPLTGAVVDFGESAAPDVIKGDILWDLCKKYKDLEFRNLMNRALWRYREAISKVGDTEKRKLLTKIAKVTDRFRAMYVHPGKASEGAPVGWGVVLGKGETREGVAVDDSRSHSGRASLRVQTAKYGLLVSERRVIDPNQDYVFGFWYLADATVDPDLVHLDVTNKTGQLTSSIRATMPPDRGDIPIWIHYETRFKSPSDSVYFRVFIDNTAMRSGTLWIDDVTLRSSAKPSEELVQNGSFEDR